MFVNASIMKRFKSYPFILTRGLKILRTVHEVRSLHLSLIKSDRTLGFVPTMGALHSGHLKLMKFAKKSNSCVIASIFVNPSQFSPGEDLDKYPRTLEKDISMLQSIGVDYLFAPNEPEIYPSSSVASQKPISAVTASSTSPTSTSTIVTTSTIQKHTTPAICHVEPTPFNSIYEGKARPEFFRGVATIVCKLFNIVQPTVAYFGQKDISQCLLIQALVHDLNMPVKIHVIETMRENDGLAMSSRNAYLHSSERSRANVLYRALKRGKEICSELGDSSNISCSSINSSVSDDRNRSNSPKSNSDSNSHTTTNINDIKDRVVDRKVIYSAVESILMSEPLVKSIEYISIASHIDMRELDQISLTQGAVLSCAIRYGSENSRVRLIDNLLVGQAEIDVLRDESSSNNDCHS